MIKKQTTTINGTTFNELKVDQQGLKELINSPKFKESKKGILLMGKPGTGKTYIMTQSTSRNAQTTSDRLHDLYLRNGGYGYRSENGGQPESVNNAIAQMFSFGKIGETATIYIDDLGTEPAFVNSFGNKTGSVIEKVIDHIYKLLNEMSLDVKANFSSNLNLEELYNHYGHRSMSRLAQICYFVELVGEDRRLNPELQDAPYERFFNHDGDAQYLNQQRVVTPPQYQRVNRNFVEPKLTNSVTDDMLNEFVKNI